MTTLSYKDINFSIEEITKMSSQMLYGFQNKLEKSANNEIINEKDTTNYFSSRKKDKQVKRNEFKKLMLGPKINEGNDNLNNKQKYEAKSKLKKSNFIQCIDDKYSIKVSQSSFSTITNTCESSQYDLVGFITYGRYSLLRGRGFGFGYISKDFYLQSEKTETKEWGTSFERIKVIIRNQDSHHYFCAELEPFIISNQFKI